jgi:Holliday junction resolvase RusA-like endonuclease
VTSFVQGGLYDDPRQPGPLRVVVPGIPQPQGSVWAVPIRSKADGCRLCHLTGGVRVIEGSNKSDAAADRFRTWRADVTKIARDAMAGRAPMTGPVAIMVTFTVPRPAKHYGTGRNRWRLRDDAPAYPHVKPDGGKYQRAVEDSFTDARVWGDDAQVVAWHGCKVYPIRTHGTAGLRIAADPTTLCGTPGADALTQPGAVIRAWQIAN